jgi:hypothetical protein
MVKCHKILKGKFITKSQEQATTISGFKYQEKDFQK